MIQEPPSKNWIIIIATIISTAGIICVAIVGLGLPFMQEYAKKYFATPISNVESNPIVIVVPATNEVPREAEIAPCTTNLAWSMNDPILGNAPTRIGRPDNNNGWSANPAEDNPGWFQVGPYTTELTSGNHTAMWYLLIDDNAKDDSEILRFEIADYSSDQVQTVLGSKIITRKDWNDSWVYQCFSLPFNLDASRDNHKLEFRIWWYGRACVSQLRVSVE